LRRRLKAVSDVDEVTLDGRLFHTREAATGNARSPMVEWRISGMMSVDEDADLRCRRESMSATLWSSLARYVACYCCQVNARAHTLPSAALPWRSAFSSSHDIAVMLDHDHSVTNGAGAKFNTRSQ